MGTNYYHYTNHCDCCNRVDVNHIGKHSGGFAFHFAGSVEQGLVSFQDWLARLEAGGHIEDEYDRPVSLDEFKTLVEQNKDLRSYSDHWPGKRPSDEWHDPEGYWFAGYSFS